MKTQLCRTTGVTKGRYADTHRGGGNKRGGVQGEGGPHQPTPKGNRRRRVTNEHHMHTRSYNAQAATHGRDAHANMCKVHKN